MQDSERSRSLLEEERRREVLLPRDFEVEPECFLNFVASFDLDLDRVPVDREDLERVEHGDLETERRRGSREFEDCFGEGRDLTLERDFVL